MESASDNGQLRTPSLRAQRPISPSRRSYRQQQVLAGDDIHSLLSNISPALLLSVLSEPSSESSALGGHTAGSIRGAEDFIRSAVSSPSSSDKAWGLKVAHFAKKVQEWELELVGWPWTMGQGDEQNEFLRRADDDQIQRFEKRAESIRAELDKLGVDELKRYVRGSHILGTSYNSPLSANDYETLDDFTALITATIVQALPRLASLHSLLGSWSKRFLILRRVPDFLRKLNDCSELMVSAQLAVRTPNSEQKPSFSRNVFENMLAILKDQVSRLAQQLDSMLDVLEGSKDTLPETWIDKMDQLENDYSSWTVKAQQIVLNNELDIQYSRSRIDFTQEKDMPSDADQEALPSSTEESTLEEPKILDHGNVQSELLPPGLAAPPIFEGQSSLSRGEEDKSGAMAVKRLNEFQLLGEQASNDMRRGSPEDSREIGLNGENKTPEGSSSADSSPRLIQAALAVYPGSPAIVSTPSPRRTSRAMFFPPMEDSDPFVRSISRQSWHGLSSMPNKPSHHRKRSSTVGDEGLAAWIMDSTPRSPTVSRFTPAYARPRSASIQSFEVVSRDAIRTIDVKRRDSDLAPTEISVFGMPVGQTALKDVSSPGRNERASASPIPSSQLITEPYKPQIDVGKPEDGSAATKASPAEIRTIGDRKAAATSVENHTVQDPGQNGKPQPMKKLQKRAFTTGGPGFSKQQQYTKSKSTELLEERLRSAIENSHADIRLSTTIDGTNVPSETSSPGSTANDSRRISVPRIIRSKTSAPVPSATLAPAPGNGFNESKNGDHSEIKIYHLHQAGKNVPIKLHIRLVGEAGERVMVRIGGGWADLGEYLKEYANHHGKRSISDSKLNIQGVESPLTSSPASSSIVSPGTQTVSPSTSPYPSDIMLSKQHTSQLGFSSPPQTPPDPTSSDIGSPSPTVGLAGPRKKTIDISPRKQAWVEGMLRQVRRTSGGDLGAGRNTQQEGNFGDIGKAGGVKRVFFRNRKESL